MYKIVSQHMGPMRSYAYWAGRPVEYAVGRWTSRAEGCGPLAAFGSLEALKSFTRSYMPHAHFPQRDEDGLFLLFECEIVPSEDACLWVNPNYRITPPPGTVTADRIMLVREVKI